MENKKYIPKIEEVFGIRIIVHPREVFPPGVIGVLIANPLDSRDFDPKKHCVIILEKK
jgi:hypothetical protein